MRRADQVAFGLAAGPPPDWFLVGLAVLSLPSEAAGEQSLVCVIDDEQWVDQASVQVLGFAARRLGADPHTYGIPAAHAPVFGLRRTQDGDLAVIYLDSFERV
jgi:hypothetical protein